MRVLITGSSGRVGRAIFSALSTHHDVVGVDRTPFSTTHIVGDFADKAVLERSLAGVEAVIHAAALHAPHVGIVPDDEFERVNVIGTRALAEAAQLRGVGRFVFTSTTALYGKAIAARGCTWVDERTVPRPKSIYHRTKLAAEAYLSEAANDGFAVRVLRMSRCFPEAADRMAIYRLHRGVDVRDVADAHALALTGGQSKFGIFGISGSTPFAESDCAALSSHLQAALEKRAPALAEAFRARGWKLPASIDRVYSSKKAEEQSGWKSRYGYAEVLAQLDRRSLEVLSANVAMTERPE